MILTIDNILLIGSVLLLISVLAGKAIHKFGVPTLILFLIIGMLAGKEGPIGINFDDLKMAQFIGIVSLNFILFSGGLDTNWDSIKSSLWQGLSLSTLGVIFTAVFLGLFVWLITDFTIYESLLLGSIVSSTDAAAVFSILRTKNVALKSNLRSTLELESGSNDPMAYVLTIAFLSMVLNPEKSFFSIIPLFLQQMTIGAIMGIAFGYWGRRLINRISLDYEGLYPAMVIALMFLNFSLTDYIGGNGFLSIYVNAIMFGNNELIHKKTIIKTFDGLAWLMQIVLFLTLGLLVSLKELYAIAPVGLLIAFFLVVAARPLSVFISLSPFKMQIRKKLFISWVGLRGAVPIVFATYPLLACIVKANIIFHIVFFVTIISVLIQGTSLPLVAKILRVNLPENLKRRTLFDAFMIEHPRANIREILIDQQCKAAGKKIVDLSFPKNAIIAMIQRNGKYLIPTGSTIIEEGDKLIILSDSEEAMECAIEAVD